MCWPVEWSDKLWFTHLFECSIFTDHKSKTMRTIFIKKTPLILRLTHQCTWPLTPDLVSKQSKIYNSSGGHISIKLEIIQTMRLIDFDSNNLTCQICEFKFKDIREIVGTIMITMAFDNLMFNIIVSLCKLQIKFAMRMAL